MEFGTTLPDTLTHSRYTWPTSYRKKNNPTVLGENCRTTTPHESTSWSLKDKRSCYAFWETGCPSGLLQLCADLSSPYTLSSEYHISCQNHIPEIQNLRDQIAGSRGFRSDQETSQHKLSIKRYSAYKASPWSLKVLKQVGCIHDTYTAIVDSTALCQGERWVYHLQSPPRCRRMLQILLTGLVMHLTVFLPQLDRLYSTRRLS